MRRLLIVFQLLLVAPLGAQNVTRQAGVDGAQYVPPLAALLSPRGTESELRDIVNRFNIDESALGRRWTVDYAPMRRTRFREFYHGWQARLRELDFDKLSQHCVSTGRSGPRSATSLRRSAPRRRASWPHSTKP